MALTASRTATAQPPSRHGTRQRTGTPVAPAAAPAARLRWKSRYRPAFDWGPVPRKPPCAATTGNETIWSTIATMPTVTPALTQASRGSWSARARVSSSTTANVAQIGGAAKNATVIPRGGWISSRSAPT